MERCPVCRATCNGETSCRRCHADLSVLLRIEREAECLVRRAAQLWASGEAKGADEAVRKSLALKHTRLACVISTLAHRGRSLP